MFKHSTKAEIMNENVDTFIFFIIKNLHSLNDTVMKVSTLRENIFSR